MKKWILYLGVVLLASSCNQGPNPNRSKGFPLDTRPHWLVFESTDSSGSSRIMAYDLEKDSIWALTAENGSYSRPIRWNDTTLALLHSRGEEVVRIALQTTTGNTSSLLPGFYEHDPLWSSPNGLMLAGQSAISDTQQVFLSRLDGKRQQWLTSGSAGGSEPQWSPDGLTLMYQSKQDGNPELYLFQLTTAHQRRLTQNDSLDTHGTWHPNGRKIGFVSNRHRTEMDLYLLDVASGRARRLTDNHWLKGNIAFSPSGRFLAFSAQPPQGTFNMYLYDLKTDSIQQITRSHKRDLFPGWITAQY